ncbi:MAG TPA: GNAT family N-acetyltransferase [Candidatus Sulfotelmatobacter sp.]|nr:GNAT family N-acetyltransferase [Candidatus Sulfotelmatobacter sp.]
MSEFTVLNIRRALLKDLDTITEIYNEAILHTVATLDTEPKTAKNQKLWFTEHDDSHPLLVAEQNGQIMGWASLTKWSDRCAYSGTAEVSLYVKKEHQGEGIGRKLLKALLEEGEKANLHTVIARVTRNNEASVHLFESEGFEFIGVMREVGQKFGKLLDVFIMQWIYVTK